MDIFGVSGGMLGSFSGSRKSFFESWREAKTTKNNGLLLDFRLWPVLRPSPSRGVFLAAMLESRSGCFLHVLVSRKPLFRSQRSFFEIRVHSLTLLESRGSFLGSPGDAKTAKNNGLLLDFRLLQFFAFVVGSGVVFYGFGAI